MLITHDILTKLGFIKSPGRNNCYHYKRETGYLLAGAGLFLFIGFSPGIGTVASLKHILMLIDHPYQIGLAGHTGNEN